MLDIPHQCDVVVIGGGPAGSLASTFLVQKGYDVVLLERQKHPRPHVGENIIPHFWKYADLAQVSDTIAAEGFIQKAGGTVVWDGVIRQMAFKDFGYTRPAYHTERDRFDEILLRNAQRQGAQVFEEVLVTEVAFNQTQQQQTVNYRRIKEKGEGQITCRFVVDASGQQSIVARQLGIRELDNSFRFMSLWGYFTGSKYIGPDGRAYDPESLSQVPPTTLVSSIAETGDWGWVWHIPLRQQTSVGLVLPIEFMKTAKSTETSWEEYFQQKCATLPILNQLLAGARFRADRFGKIADYSYRSTHVAGPGYFLIGDAAGFIDPIFSVGVVLGMYSAYLAAWTIDRSFKSPDRTHQHQDFFSRQLMGRLEVSRSLALPRYQAGEQTSHLAQRSVQFESSLEQELMNVVSQMTTRSANFQNLVKEPAPSATADKFKVLEGIEF
ncbi:MAG: NAD(P)/FAD-dependent oxidoreductase [Pleurocapsa sp. MO_226.B13]|nr:NAD(P)/FAD-dependent oxidoreductase [Pleurocapsa sp. MO_226.B13]